MNITNINRLNNIKCPFKSNSLCFKGLIKEDTFEKTTAKEISEGQSFEDFSKWADDNDFLNNANKIANVSANILGSGFEGIVYEIPKTNNWVLKRYKRSDFVPVHTEKPVIHEIKDIAPKINIGQTIAQVQIPSNNPQYSYQYWILKKQTGKNYGVAKEYSDSIDKFSVKTHIDALKKLSMLPQSAYDKCIKDVMYITSLGYAFDYCNLNNIMIDEDKKEIHFIDINDKHNGKTEQFAEMLYCLLGGDFGKNFVKNCKDIEEYNQEAELSKQITDKFFTAMKKQNVKFNSKGYINSLAGANMLNNTLKTESKEEQFKKLSSAGLI